MPSTPLGYNFSRLIAWLGLLVGVFLQTLMPAPALQKVLIVPRIVIPSPYYSCA